MSDIRKAAILLMSLPEDQAAALMTKLTAKQIERVERIMRRAVPVGGPSPEG